MKNISDAIINRFEQGFSVTEDIIDFASSTLGIAKIEHLSSYLHNDEAYSSGLMDLIVSPDFDAKISLEPLLGPQGLSEKDIGDIIQEATSAIASIVILQPYDTSTFTVKPEEYLIKAYIKKLNLQKSYNQQFLQLSETYKKPILIIMARTMVRTMKYHRTEKREDFIIRLIEKHIQSKTEDLNLRKDLQILLTIFSEKFEDGDIFTTLALKKNQWEQQLNEADRFNKLLTRYSMELLMMQRITPPAINIDEVIDNIATLDSISHFMFGKTANLNENPGVS